MRKSKGFTLIELMVVILIVAILAAVLAPMMTGRIRDAKWTEGKAAAGTIATAIRAWAAEHEGATDDTSGQTIVATFLGTDAEMAMIGVTTNDLDGKYFDAGDYTVIVTAGDFNVDPVVPLAYTIQIDGTPIGSSDTWQLDQDGTWSLVAAAAP